MNSKPQKYLLKCANISVQEILLPEKNLTTQISSNRGFLIIMVHPHMAAKQMRQFCIHEIDPRLYCTVKEPTKEEFVLLEKKINNKEMCLWMGVSLCLYREASGRRGMRLNSGRQ